MAGVAKKLGIALASLAVFLGATELVLRVVGYRLPPPVPPLVIWNPEEDKRLADSEALHEAATRQLWRPRPGAAVPWGKAQDEHINAEGYRGPLLARAKTPGVLRIATFGDSSTFGMGVAWPETYSAKLVDELSKRGVRAEVVDAGVIGFTSEQGLERYQELVRELRPDVVTLAFGAVNDHFPTKDLEDREKIAESVRRAAERRPVADWFRAHVRLLHLYAGLVEWRAGVDRERLAKALMQARGEQKKLEATMGRIDWPGRRRVSLARFEENLTRFTEWARADGATDVVLISMPRHPDNEAKSPVLVAYNQTVSRVGEKLGLRVFDARARVARELENGATWEELFVDFYHPSPRGHAIFAAELAALLAPER